MFSRDELINNLQNYLAINYAPFMAREASVQVPLPTMQMPLPANQIPLPTMQTPLLKEQSPLPKPQASSPKKQAKNGLFNKLGRKREAAYLSDDGISAYAESSIKPAAPSLRESIGIDSFIKESFDQNAVAKQLNLYMFERDITTAMIYERCFIDRRLISKITGGSGYHPSKPTMLALCIGLRLSFEEAENFLGLAGYSFSNSFKSDMILKYMLMNGVYDLDTINDMLDHFGETCIGA